jgi:hypothetical protein
LQQNLPKAAAALGLEHLFCESTLAYIVLHDLTLSYRAHSECRFGQGAMEVRE